MALSSVFLSLDFDPLCSYYCCQIASSELMTHSGASFMSHGYEQAQIPTLKLE